MLDLNDRGFYSRSECLCNDLAPPMPIVQSEPSGGLMTQDPNGGPRLTDPESDWGHLSYVVSVTVHLAWLSFQRELPRRQYPNVWQRWGTLFCLWKTGVLVLASVSPSRR